ncbi:hypothetical protein CSAL01_02072, partial [Colletotrichum salicis]
MALLSCSLITSNIHSISTLKITSQRIQELPKISPTSPTQEPWSLVGKIAIVTGASRGIGQAIAIHLAHKGLSKLAITYASNSDAAQKTLEECRRLGVEAAIAIQADALDPSFGAKIVSQTLQQLSPTSIDILVNNAVLSDYSKVEPIKDTTLPVFLQ